MIGSRLIALAAIPFSLTIGPAKVAHVMLPGTGTRVIVWDTGSHPVSVTMELHAVSRSHGKCAVSARPVGWALASPARFTLAPGRHEVVRVRVGRYGTGHPGPRTLAIAATVAQGTRGAVRINAAVATLALVRFPGRSHGRPCVSLGAPKRSAGPPLAELSGIAAVVLAAILVAWGVMLRRHRNNGRHV